VLVHLLLDVIHPQKGLMFVLVDGSGEALLPGGEPLGLLLHRAAQLHNYLLLPLKLLVVVVVDTHQMRDLVIQHIDLALHLGLLDNPGVVVFPDVVLNSFEDLKLPRVLLLEQNVLAPLESVLGLL